MLSGRAQYSKTILFQMPPSSPTDLQLFSPSTIFPPLPLPRGFSIPCHTWPPPAHYAMFCVMPVDAGASGVRIISIHLRKPIPPPSFPLSFCQTDTSSVYLPTHCSILHLCQCTSADGCKVKLLTYFPPPLTHTELD